MKNWKTTLLVFWLFSLSGISSGQSDSVLLQEWKSILQLDTVTIFAPGVRFDIPSFMRLVLEDKSLYQSFRNLHTIPYSARHKMVVLDKSNSISDFYSANTVQELKYGCRKIRFLNKNFSPGYFNKSKKHRFYTTAIYERMFLLTEMVCAGSKDEESQKQSGMLDTYTSKIKRLVFSPAQRTFLPFIGDQNMIFSKKHRDKYNFNLRKIRIDSLDLYEFNIRKKPGISDDEILIESMNTWFDASDLSVIRRIMVVRKNTMLYDIDIKIDVGTHNENGIYVPDYMKYTGNWHVPFKKRERISFFTRFSY